MKTCTVCGDTKPAEDFHYKDKAKGERRGTCKVCISKRQAKYWQTGKLRDGNYQSKKKRVEAGRDFIWQVLIENPCVDCGESDPIVLEFDHIGSDKIDNVSRMLTNFCGTELIKAEVAKCEVVCANCHRKRTAARGNHWRHTRSLN